MPSLNKVFLIGNTTRDVELKYTSTGTPIGSFAIAVNRSWKTADGQEKKEILFVNCNCFGKQAETLHQYVKKGHPLFIEGRLKLDEWEGQDGQKKSLLKVIVENFQFLPYGDKPVANTPTSTSTQAPPQQATPPQAVQTKMDIEEEIPF